MTSRVGLVLIGLFAFGFSLLVSTVPVPRIPVVIKVVVDEVGLQLATDWEIYDFPLSELTAVNWGQAELVGGVATRHGGYVQDARENLVAVARPGVSAWSASFSSDYLQMNLSIPAGAQTRLKLLRGNSSSLQMTVAGEGAFASLDTAEDVDLRCQSCLLQNADTQNALPSSEVGWHLRPAHRSIGLYAGQASLLTMRVLDGSMEAGQLTTGLELRASKVDFQRAGPSSPVSAISGRGTIAFPGLETDPIQIGPGDFLYVAMARSLNPLKPIEPFQIRSISVGKAIEVELRGAVGKLALGPGGALRSKMPTLLQYVYWNSWLQMLIGAALTIGAAVSSLLYRFGFLSKEEK